MGKIPGAPLACTACTEAKRKCTKQHPRCRRCKSKGLVCRYPPGRPSTFVPLVTQDPPTPRSISSSDHVSPLGSSGSVGAVTTSGDEANETTTSILSTHTIKSQSWWFETPDTWLIDQAPGGIKRLPPSADDLEAAVQTLRGWMSRWMNNDVNPLIHTVLYQNRMPSSIQDAYMALVMYTHRAAGNLSIVRHIIEEKACALVVSGSSVELDLLDHLARVQALLVYQVIGIFDGNKQLRYISECNIPTLTEWVHDLVDRARQHADLGRVLLSKKQKPSLTLGEFWERDVWHSWIVAESIRRTWLMVSMVQGMHLTRQDGIDHCLGGMMFTSRRGFWDAPDAFSWQEHCMGVHGGLVRLPDVYKLFARVDPNDLDEFAELVLKVTFSSKQLEKWRRECQPA